MLEHLLTKRRILEIYLNSVEWGEAFSAPKPPHSTTFANRRPSSAA